MAATYKVYVDWNDDGDFSDASEDVTARVLDGRGAVTARYGRDQHRALSPTAPGEGGFVLNNHSRDYSPENTSSPIYDQVVPARQVQITATAAGSTTTLLRAQLDDIKVAPGTGNRYLQATLVDALGTLRGVSVSTGVYQALRPGEAMGILLDAAGFPADLRDIQTGTTVMPFWWLDGDDAYDALMDLVATEGPPSLLTLDSTGRIVFRGRHHRLQQAASLTAQSTWRSSGIEPCISDPTDYNHGFKEIINTISFEMPQRRISGVDSVVWQGPDALSIASGDTVTLEAQGGTPFIDAITPVASTDYDLASGTVAITLSRTSGASTVISITASGGSTAVVQNLQLRARAVETVTTLRVSAEDGGSVTKYGRRSLPDVRVPKWASLADANGICRIILGARGERLATISVTMRAGGHPSRLTQQLTRNLSDRVRVDEEHTGLNADCYIEQISHTIGQGGTEHVTQFGLEKVPVQVADVFILGSATSGVLGTNRLGRTGFMDPANVFTLGSATNGVLGSDVLAA
jgi:hypothetical protein